jgi:hypothetical protein
MHKHGARMRHLRRPLGLLLQEVGAGFGRRRRLVVAEGDQISAIDMTNGESVFVVHGTCSVWVATVLTCHFGDFWSDKWVSGSELRYASDCKVAECSMERTTRTLRRPERQRSNYLWSTAMGERQSSVCF